MRRLARHAHRVPLVTGAGGVRIALCRIISRRDSASGIVIRAEVDLILRCPARMKPSTRWPAQLGPCGDRAEQSAADRLVQSVPPAEIICLRMSGQSSQNPARLRADLFGWSKVSELRRHTRPRGGSPSRVRRTRANTL